MTKTLSTRGSAILRGELKAAREAQGMSQRSLADAVNCDHITIYRIETGQRRVDVIELLALTNVLKVDPRHLITLVLEGSDPTDYEYVFK